MAPDDARDRDDGQDDGLHTSTTPVTTDAPVDDPDGRRRPEDVDPLTGAPTDREAPTR